MAAFVRSFLHSFTAASLYLIVAGRKPEGVYKPTGRQYSLLLPEKWGQQIHLSVIHGLENPIQGNKTVSFFLCFIKVVFDIKKKF